MAMLNDQRVIPVFFLDGFSSRLCPLLDPPPARATFPWTLSRARREKRGMFGEVEVGPRKEIPLENEKFMAGFIDLGKL